nr:unnamed protein product [Callosobruchus analis]
MDIGQFYNWNDLSSKFKLKKSNFYFKELVLAIFSRNNFNFKYKSAFEHEEYKVLDFLINKATKNGAEKPTARIRNRGVDESRKNSSNNKQQTRKPHNLSSIFKES